MQSEKLKEKKSTNRALALLLAILAFGGAVSAIVLAPGTKPQQKNSQANPLQVPEGLRTTLSESVFQIKATFTEAKDSDNVLVKYGSCICVSPTGVFLTAAHTVTSDQPVKSLTLLTRDRELKPTVRHIDALHDVAVLSVNGYEGKSLSVSHESVLVDSVCYTFGFPTKYAGTVFPELKGLRGIVERPDFPHETELGDNLPVMLIRGSSHFGVSGGAVVDKSGNLIGMSFASRFPSEKSDNPTHLLAIPAIDLKLILTSRLGAAEEGD